MVTSKKIFLNTTAGEGFCHVTIWPEKVSFTPLYIDSIIAQQRKMQNQQDLLSSTLAN